MKSGSKTVGKLTFLLIGLSLLLPSEGHPGEGKSDSAVYPGHITNGVHPGNPVQEVAVAGFGSMKEALQFVNQSFHIGSLKPRLNTRLRRGEIVRFGDAAYIVFYYYDAKNKPVLLSITRCHSDLHLVIGSCGYQFLLGVKTSPATQESVR